MPSIFERKNAADQSAEKLATALVISTPSSVSADAVASSCVASTSAEKLAPCFSSTK